VVFLEKYSLAGLKDQPIRTDSPAGNPNGYGMRLSHLFL